MRNPRKIGLTRKRDYPFSEVAILWDMSSRKPTVVLGILGPTLDGGSGPRRWDRWRPTVALCQHEDFVVSRFELLFGARHRDLAARVTKDIAQVSPETEVREVPF